MPKIVYKWWTFFTTKITLQHDFYFKIEKITGQDHLICSFTSQQDQRDSVCIRTFVILKIFIYYK